MNELGLVSIMTRPCMSYRYCAQTNSSEYTHRSDTTSLKTKTITEEYPCIMSQNLDVIGHICNGSNSDIIYRDSIYIQLS